MRKLVATVSSLMLLGVVLIGVVRVINTNSTSPVAEMLSAGDCPLPCWNNIRPGQTPRLQAIAMITHDARFDPDPIVNVGNQRCYRMRQPPLWSVCLRYDAALIFVQKVVISAPKPMNLGDIINIYGTPMAWMINFTTDYGYNDNLTLFFQHGESLVLFTKNFHFRPNLTVQWVALEPSYEVEGIPVAADRLEKWRGFIQIPRVYRRMLTR